VCGWFLSVPAGAAEDESLGAVAKSYFEKAIRSAKSLVSGKETEEEESAAAAAEESEEAVLEKAVKAATAQIFHKEGTQYFTQSRWGAEPTPYEVTGLELVYLGDAAITAGDKAAGIDRRVTYEFRAAQHRRFHPQTGWGRWLKGVPPHLENIMLERENGVWKVASSPLWAYSVK
jgi:hypothetical protein